MTDIQTILSQVENQTDANQVAELEIPAHLAFELVSKAEGLKFSFNCEGDLIRSIDTTIQKKFFMLRNAISHDQVKDVIEDLVFMLFGEAVKGSIDEVVQLVKDNSPRDQQLAWYASAKMTSELTDKYDEKREKVLKHISIKTDNPNIKSVKLDGLEGLGERLVKKAGNQFKKKPIYLVTAPPGVGKTENVTIPAFELACELGLNPVGISPKKILTSKIINDKRNYQHEDCVNQNGLFSVVDSIVTKNKFAPNREKMKVLIAEEHEEIASQSAKKPTIQNTLESRAELLGGYYELIKNTEVVILIDGMFSTAEAEKIQEITGRKIVEIKCDPKYKNETVINVLKEAEMLARAQTYLADNKNILVFNDANNKGEKSKFNEIAHAIKFNSKSTNILTAKTIAEMDDAVEYMSNIEKTIEDYQATILSPVAPSGISFTNGHFDAGFSFLNQVISVKTALQSIKRDRLLKENNVCFYTNFSPKVLDKRSIVSEELKKNNTALTLTENYISSKANNKDIDNLASIIVEENRMRIDYEASMIIAMRELGYVVKVDSDNEELGKEIRKKGKEIEEEERVEKLINAEKINYEQYSNLERKDSITNKEMYEMASFEMRDFYDVEAVDESLIGFDQKGDKRKVLKNNMIAISETKAQEVKNAKKAIQKAVVDDIFETLNIDPFRMTGIFNKLDAEALINKFKFGQYDIQGMKVTGASAFITTFGTKLPKGHALSAVCGLLSGKFGIKTSHAGQQTINGKRVNKKAVRFEDMCQITFDVLKTLCHDVQSYEPNIEDKDRIVPKSTLSTKDRMKAARMNRSKEYVSSVELMKVI